MWSIKSWSSADFSIIILFCLLLLCAYLSVAVWVSCVFQKTLRVCDVFVSTTGHFVNHSSTLMYVKQSGALEQPDLEIQLDVSCCVILTCCVRLWSSQPGTCDWRILCWGWAWRRICITTYPPPPPPTKKLHILFLLYHWWTEARVRDGICLWTTQKHQSPPSSSSSSTAPTTNSSSSLSTSSLSHLPDRAETWSLCVVNCVLLMLWGWWECREWLGNLKCCRFHLWIFFPPTKATTSVCRVLFQNATYALFHCLRLCKYPSETDALNSSSSTL